MTQYLTKESLLKTIINFEINLDCLISADSYNEEELLKEYNNIDEKRTKIVVEICNSSCYYW